MVVEPIARRSRPESRSRVVSLMERAPQFVIYALHVPYIAYLMLRYRGVTLPTVANPGLDGGGLTRESKAEIFRLFGPVGRAHHPPFITIWTGRDALPQILAAMSSEGLEFPVVVKPDIGRRGFGVKIVQTEHELAGHLERFPSNICLLIQRYAEGPGEAGMFYVRWPSEEHGRVLSLTLKHFPEVVGDGTSSLRELILKDKRARFFASVYLKRNRAHLDRVIPFGEAHRLVSIGNHVRGAAFEDGSHLITPAMERLCDTVAKEIEGFHVGRFDIRYRSLEALRRGEDIAIIECNGAGGEPTYIWDPRVGVLETYAGLLRHVKFLFAIGAQNRARGSRPMKVRELVRRYVDELRLLRAYPDAE